MSDWIHCSGCFARPGSQAGKFFLASCGEIFCQKCISEPGSGSTCRVCKQQMQLLEINRQLKPDLQLFFLDPKEVVKRQNKQLAKILEFQAKHRSHEQRMHQEQMKKVEKLMGHFKQEMEKKAELEKNYSKLKEEYKRLYEEKKKFQQEYNQLAQQHKSFTEQEERRKRSKQERYFSEIGKTGEQFESGTLFQNFTDFGGNVMSPTSPNSASTPKNQVLSAGRITTALKAGKNTGSGGHKRTPTKSSPVPSITTPVMLGLSASAKTGNPYDGVWQQSESSPMRISPQTVSRSSFGSSVMHQPPVKLPFTMNRNALQHS